MDELTLFVDNAIRCGLWQPIYALKTQRTEFYTDTQDPSAIIKVVKLPDLRWSSGVKQATRSKEITRLSRIDSNYIPRYRRFDLFHAHEKLLIIMDKHETFQTALSLLAPCLPNDLFFATLLLHMGSALSDLHDYAIVHRDVKLENVLFQYNSNLGFHFLLADVDEAKVLEQVNTAHIGTEHLRAPEIASGKYDSPIDIFALGADILHFYANHAYQPSEAIHSILKAMISPDPSKRPTAKDLKTLADGLFESRRLGQTTVTAAFRTEIVAYTRAVQDVDSLERQLAVAKERREELLKVVKSSLRKVYTESRD